MKFGVEILFVIEKFGVEILFIIRKFVVEKVYYSEKINFSKNIKNNREL